MSLKKKKKLTYTCMLYQAQISVYQIILTSLWDVKVKIMQKKQKVSGRYVGTKKIANLCEGPNPETIQT